MKTPQTVCCEIFCEILREARQFDTDKYLVMASQVVIDLPAESCHQKNRVLDHMLRLSG
jgi:hypothetical protein